MSFIGLDSFYEAAANGTLPEVSFVIGPTELSEHPPYMPKDGAWLQKQVVDAVVKGPKYNSTMLIISYDGMCFEVFVNLLTRPRNWRVRRPRHPIPCARGYPWGVDGGSVWPVRADLCRTR